MQLHRSKACEVLAQAIAAGEIPSAVAIAGTQESWDYVTVAGVRRYGGERVTAETVYDLASLTKVVSTLPAILKLVSEGELSLLDKVGKFFSNAGWFQSPSLADVSIQQLLTHSSGLPAWKPLFSLSHNRLTAIANVLQTGLEHPTSSIQYSDLGFILLGAIIERVTNLRQDKYVNQYVFKPLGMNHTGYGPLYGEVVAATEDCGWRNQLLVGVVHDENAFVMDGVAGHAGLFGRAEDLARYAQAWLRFDRALGKEGVVRLAVSELAKAEHIRRGLGWMLWDEASSAGQLASPSTYGHTGFTGTSIWIDPEQDWFSVLLTNRVHPSRHCGKNMHTLRVSFHEALHGVKDA